MAPKRKPPAKAKPWAELVPAGELEARNLETGELFFTGRVWENDLYQVIVRDRSDIHSEDAGVVLPEGWLWLNIVPRSKGRHRHDWRAFQAIKDQLLGPERSAFELYPPASRLLDTSNAWHLWAPPEGLEVPVGFFRARQVYARPGDRSTAEEALSA